MSTHLRGIGRAISLFLYIEIVAVEAVYATSALDRLTPVPNDEPVPIVDYFRPHIFEDPKLNSTGTHFAAIVSTKEDNHDLLSYELATKKIERISGGADYDIYGFDWLNDKRLFFSAMKDKMYSVGLFAAEVGHFHHPLALQRNNVVVPVGFPKKTPLEAIVWIRNSASKLGRDDGAMRIDTGKFLERNDQAILFSGDDGARASVIKNYPLPKNGETLGYISDRQGELAFVVTTEGGVRTLQRFVGDRWVRTPVQMEAIEILQAGDKPGELLVLAPSEGHKPRGLYRLDAETGKLGELLFQDEKYDLDTARIYRHPVDQRILGIQYHCAAPCTVWFEPDYERIQKKLERALPKRLVRIIGSDLEEKQFFISASSDTEPTTYYHVKLDTNSFSLLANVAPWIDPQRASPMQVLSYKTRDGFTVEGYLTLPAGTSKERPAPLLVLPHGGPWVRDTWGWDAEAQFFAGRGFAVFQPNYRFSLGTSRQFPEEDRWAFRKMHDDVTDGVRKLLKSGLVDSKRVAIMGSSFGGYLALSGAAYEPALYRCAVTVAGVFDWEKLITQSRGSEYLRGSYDLLKRKLGDPRVQREKFDEISPLRHVDQIKCPVFVAHGSGDIVVDVEQSQQLIAQLKRHHIPFEKHLVHDEGHGFHHLDNQVALYGEIEAFLVKNMELTSPAEALGK